jgi:outer membrane protein
MKIQGYFFRLFATFFATWLIALAAQAQTIQLSREEMLRHVELLISNGQFAEAKPYIEAMQKDSVMASESALLRGLVANHDQDWKQAEKNFRAVLAQKPKWTRARLELARSLYNQGERQAADHHFRLAESDNLPTDVARVVQDYRQSIRAKKNWRFNVQFGLAPDTNINSGTNADVITFKNCLITDLCGFVTPEESKQKTGLGQIANLGGSVRVPVSEVYAIEIEASARLVNYVGSTYDDFSISPAIGLSRDFGKSTRIGLSALYNQRWYGGAAASRNVGARLSLQHLTGPVGQLKADASVLRKINILNTDYSGMNYSLNLAYDQVVSKTTFASVAVFASRDALENSFFANSSAGLSLRLDAELPLGINGGGNVSAAYSWFDDPTSAFDARRDWTLQGYAYLGLRSVRIFSFSPSVEYRFTRNASNLPLYDFTRHRFEFALASYF